MYYIAKIVWRCAGRQRAPTARPPMICLKSEGKKFGLTSVEKDYLVVKKIDYDFTTIVI